ncbi:hypothetical protein PVAND_010540 [Polypedilum vanderplanki]|uniref:Uncharacterized protein n=1 Tax=Polypedilum vanderplanki TaxID=319348 RepID=A0A9J6CFX8_POLVA|nr:hypothetical protein PVAND_010540 [Polypedilum vanderplanki]
MKIALVFLFAICGAQLVTSAPRNEEDERTIICVGRAIAELGLEGIAGGARLIAEIWRTVDELIEGRRRCMEMTNERLREACLTTWTIGAIAELLRLRNEIATVVGDEKAQEFFESMAACFNLDPNHPDYPDPIRLRRFF